MGKTTQTVNKKARAIQRALLRALLLRRWWAAAVRLAVRLAVRRRRPPLMTQFRFFSFLPLGPPRIGCSAIERAKSSFRASCNLLFDSFIRSGGGGGGKEEEEEVVVVARGRRISCVGAFGRIACVGAFGRIACVGAAGSTEMIFLFWAGGRFRDIIRLVPRAYSLSGIERKKEKS